MSALGHVVIERFTHVAPFGLGLWDAASGSLVSDGFEVRVYTMSNAEPHSPVVAAANRAGFFVAQNFLSLHAFEAGVGDEAFWSALPAARSYLVEVRDTLSRYTPFVMHVDLPAPRGLVVPRCFASSPPTATGYVPLFPTASRPVPAGMAVVRATLYDADSGKPARLAVLEVRDAGRLLGRGISDDRGEVAAIFAYPEPPDPPADSPPPGSPLASPIGASMRAQPLATQVWRLDISVRYERLEPTWRPDASRPPLVDVCEALAQRPAVIALSPPVTLIPAQLEYGRELVLGARPRTRVSVRPAP